MLRAAGPEPTPLPRWPVGLPPRRAYHRPGRGGGLAQPLPGPRMRALAARGRPAAPCRGPPGASGALTVDRCAPDTSHWAGDAAQPARGETAIRDHAPGLAAAPASAHSGQGAHRGTPGPPVTDYANGSPYGASRHESPFPRW